MALEDIELDRPGKASRSFYIKDSTSALVDDLATAYGTSASQIADAVLAKYGAVLLKQKQGAAQS